MSTPTGRFIDLDHLLVTEETTIEQTMAGHGDRSVILQRIINLVFKMLYFMREENIPPNIDEEFFQLQAHSAYNRLPYSLWSVHENWIRGYYIEGLCIVRHIMEGFAKVRYFNNHKADLRRHNFATRQ